MKFQHNIGIHSIHTRKINRKHSKNSKKLKPKTRRFYYRKPQCKSKLKFSGGGIFTDVNETDIIRPLKQKAGYLQIEPYAKGTSKLVPEKKEKPDENKNANADKSKKPLVPPPVPKENKMNTYDYGIESLVEKDNKNIDTVNNFFRQMLEIESKWERKFIAHKEFKLPNNDPEKKNDNLEPKMEYKVSVLQNLNQEEQNYLEPIFDIKKTPNQSLKTLNDIIPVVTGDEIIEYENKTPEEKTKIDKTFIEGKLKTPSIEEQTEISPKKPFPIEEKPEISLKKIQEQKEDELLNETSLALLLSLINAEKESENDSKTPLEPNPEPEENIEELVASAILAETNQ